MCHLDGSYSYSGFYLGTVTLTRYVRPKEGYYSKNISNMGFNIFLKQGIEYTKTLLNPDVNKLAFVFKIGRSHDKKAFKFTIILKKVKVLITEEVLATGKFSLEGLGTFSLSSIKLNAIYDENIKQSTLLSMLDQELELFYQVTNYSLDSSEKEKYIDIETKQNKPQHFYILSETQLNIMFSKIKTKLSNTLSKPDEIYFHIEQTLLNQNRFKIQEYKATKKLISLIESNLVAETKVKKDILKILNFRKVKLELNK